MTGSLRAEELTTFGFVGSVGYVGSAEAVRSIEFPRSVVEAFLVDVVVSSIEPGVVGVGSVVDGGVDTRGVRGEGEGGEVDNSEEVDIRKIRVEEDEGVEWGLAMDCNASKVVFISVVCSFC